MDLLTYDRMSVEVHDDAGAMGEAAAACLAAILKEALASRGEASIILASAASQESFLAALPQQPEVDWSRVTIFHMDEYLGLPEDHPASFRRFIRRRVADVLHPCAFHGIAGDAPDPVAEMKRYATLLAEHAPIACVLGIGENGHLAFNEPPADFDTSEPLQHVRLDEASRRQQVGEGHFARIDDVPTHAITLTIPTLLRPPHVLGVVPERRKAEPVRAALEGPVTPNVPASILRRHAHVRLYLDRESASLLARDKPDYREC